MLSEQRRQSILGEVQRSGQVRTKDLSDGFGVSEVTVRSDLEILDRKGLLTKTRGGAVTRTTDSTTAAFARRMQTNLDAKKRIARAALDLFEDNQSVIFDGGSTLMQVAMQLPPLSNVVVAATAMNIVQHLMHRPGLDVHMIGGRVYPDTVSTLITDADTALGGLVAHQVFVGAHAIDSSLDVVDVNEDMARTKRNLVRMARRVVLLADSSKWGVSGTSKAFSLSAVDVVITDDGLPGPIRSQLEMTVAKVIYA
ncbi:DeoR/GlpR family DNA-binding transcription regulator [Mesorhizobium sp.]|uniref:DeoR/GlpR family DNA-binding transcription regulator n=1 Tax=Mesorhizobium sp. TaxID=1871066 RepID=UPI000FE89771|nr:DeoR/GlpR family DNA-binding transcription regulator [Mesorhizobium sp.]RWO59762.1 MAG: DeoR/GlpR transcriptional regulator [Mesorhizobium sp.]